MQSCLLQQKNQNTYKYPNYIVNNNSKIVAWIIRINRDVTNLKYNICYLKQFVS